MSNCRSDSLEAQQNHFFECSRGPRPDQFLYCATRVPIEEDDVELRLGRSVTVSFLTVLDLAIATSGSRQIAYAKKINFS